MPVLNPSQRAAVWAALMETAQEAGVPGSVLKADLREAVDAADQWVEDNASSFNSALPAKFRTAADVSQKIVLLSYVLERRRRALGGN